MASVIADDKQLRVIAPNLVEIADNLEANIKPEEPVLENDRPERAKDEAHQVVVAREKRKMFEVAG